MIKFKNIKIRPNKKYIIIGTIAGITISALLVASLLIAIPKTVDGGVLYIKGIQPSSNSIDIAQQNVYSKIPDKLLKDFNNDGLKVTIEGRYAYHNKYDKSAGYCGFDTDNTVCDGIHVRNDWGMYDDQAVTICHEFGHYLDYKLGWISDSQEWQEIAAEEYASSRCAEYDDGYFSDPREFFAQEFMYNIRYTGKEQAIENTNCPKAQQYIAEVIAKYESED